MAQGKSYVSGVRREKDKKTGKLKTIKIYSVWSEQTQTKAIELLAHYGHGKPVTAIELRGEGGGDVNFNVTVKKFG